MKHVGMVENTGRRCIVVFRQVYDDKGKVVEPYNCIVVETDTLPDHAHQDIISIVESEPAQRTGNLYEVLARTRMTEGSVALNWLHNNGRLKKYSTNNIVLLPNSNVKIKLSKVNRIIELQQSGYSQEDIERVMRDDTDAPPKMRERVTTENVETLVTEPVEVVSQPVVSPLMDANHLLEQAELMMTQAKKLQEQAQLLIEAQSASKPVNTVKKRNTTKKTKPSEIA